MKRFKNILLLPVLTVAMLAAGCSKEFDDPKHFEPVKLTPTMTIKAFKALYTGTPTEIQDDVIIGGKIISTDRNGNIYRSFYIQDETGGLEVKIGKTGLYNLYHEGQTIYIKARHLVLGTYGGTVNLGSKDPTGQYQTSYIDTDYRINQTIFRGEYGAPVTPRVITSYSQLTPDMNGTLVEIRGAIYSGLDFCQFTADDGVTKIQIDTVTTWGLPAYPQNVPKINASYVSQEFKLDNKSLIVRTSGYARFARDRVETLAPKGTPVTITAIYTLYGSDSQLLLNRVGDVK